MASSRSRRATTGQRMTELVGQALEDDETFYSNEIWNDEGESSGNDSYSDEEQQQEPDVFDSDFNESESEEDEDDEEEGTLRKAEASQKRKSGTEGNRYREPTKPIKRKREERVSDEESEENESDGEKAAKPIKHPRVAIARKRIDPVLLGSSGLSSNSLLSDSSTRQVRGSTQAKSNEAMVARINEQAAIASKIKPTRVIVRSTFTQKQLLEEALLTEEENQRWIEVKRMEASAKDSQKEKQAKIHTGGFKRFISKRGSYPTITFSDLDSMPYILKL